MIYSFIVQCLIVNKQCKGNFQIHDISMENLNIVLIKFLCPTKEGLTLVFDFCVIFYHFYDVVSYLPGIVLLYDDTDVFIVSNLEKDAQCESKMLFKQQKKEKFYTDKYMLQSFCLSLINFPRPNFTAPQKIQFDFIESLGQPTWPQWLQIEYDCIVFYL